MVRKNTNPNFSTTFYVSGHCTTSCLNFSRSQPISLKALEAKIAKIKDAVVRLKSGGITPWALTSEGKEELEDIRHRKEQMKKSTKENAQVFMSELEQGLDENAE